MEFQKPTVKHEKDLIEIQGKVLSYSFEQNTGSKKNGLQYYIWLENLPCRFQISADFASHFKGTKFISNVRFGDEITVMIPKSMEKQTSDKEQSIRIFSLSDYRKVYLNAEKSINKHNSNFPIYIGIIFMIIGLFTLSRVK